MMTHSSDTARQRWVADNERCIAARRDFLWSVFSTMDRALPRLTPAQARANDYLASRGVEVAEALLVDIVGWADDVDRDLLHEVAGQLRRGASESHTFLADVLEAYTKSPIDLLKLEEVADRG